MKNGIKFLSVLLIIALVSFKPINDKKVIIIDAGHGGEDLGVAVGHLTEKNIVNTISMKIKEQNKNKEVEIILLRQNDNFMTLEERVAKINSINPSLLISLHVNTSKNNTDNGVSAYASKDNVYYDKSKENAKNLMGQISNKNIAKREVQDANFYVLKNSKCPALLLQLGYLSNENDKEYIASEKGQNEIANEISNYLGK